MFSPYLRSLPGLAQRSSNMCCTHAGPPYGIPISPEIHEQYSDQLKAAWETFHSWWKVQDGTPRRSNMPEDVSEAMKLICESPIPGMDETGEMSCYMVGVDATLID